MERNDRISALIEDLPPEELRRTTLQAVDHAYKTAAEVAETTARFEGALGIIAELRDENRRLRERLERASEPRPHAGTPGPRRLVLRSAGWVRGRPRR